MFLLVLAHPGSPGQSAAAAATASAAAAVLVVPVVVSERAIRHVWLYGWQFGIQGVYNSWKS